MTPTIEGRDPYTRIHELETALRQAADWIASHDAAGAVAYADNLRGIADDERKDQ
jgi:hypothetical protein